MARTKTKSGSKTKTNCPVCGKVFTKAGIVGHMAWVHGKDHKAPLLNLEKPKPMQYQEAIGKAKLHDTIAAHMEEGGSFMAELRDGKVVLTRYVDADLTEDLRKRVKNPKAVIFLKK